MSERYIRVGYSDIELYGDNSPVIVEKSAILFDSAKGLNLLQFKLQNIQEKVIACLGIKVIVTQTETGESHEYAHTYYELSAGMNAYFGENDAIYIQEKEGAKCTFDVYITGIAYAAGILMQTNLKLYPVGKPESVDQLGSLSQTFVRAVNESKCWKKAEFIPQKIGEGWRCSCGSINHRDNGSCRSCGAEKEFLFKIISDNDLLNSKLNEYQEKDRIARKRNKRIIKAIIGACIIIAVIFGILAAINSIKNSASEEFSKASEYARSGEFEEADAILESVWISSEAIKNLKKAIDESKKLMKEKPAGKYTLIEAINLNTKKNVDCYTDKIQIRYIVSDCNPRRIITGGENGVSLYWYEGTSRISGVSPSAQYVGSSIFAGAEIRIEGDKCIIIRTPSYTKDSIRYVFKWTEEID